MPLVEHELSVLLEHLRSSTVVSGVRVTISLLFGVVFCRSLFVLLLLATVLYVLQLIVSNYSFGIFKRFLDRFQDHDRVKKLISVYVLLFRWLSRNRVNRFEWSDMSTRGLCLSHVVYPTRRVGLIHREDHHLFKMELVFAIQLLPWL